MIVLMFIGSCWHLESVRVQKYNVKCQEYFDIAHVEDYTATEDKLVLLNDKTITLVYFFI